jgi:hypothetical protein
LLAALRERMAERHLTPGQVAPLLGLSRPGLVKILKGETGEPYRKTQKNIHGWIQWDDVVGDAVEYESKVSKGETVATPQPEEELLTFFLEHHPEMAVFMSTTTDGLNAEDRRKVAVAIFNGFKKLAIEAGERLPDWFFDLERRFVAE